MPSPESDATSDRQRAQLDALETLHDLFGQHEISYWVFGGWAVDLHAGRITRPHADLDLAVWTVDVERVTALLGEAGWRRTPSPDEDGYAQFAQASMRIDLAFLARDDDGTVYTPLEDGRGDWPAGAFGEDVATLDGVQARVVSVASLLADKSEPRDDPMTLAKDRADVEILRRRAREA
jgi:hypothetical protein